MSKPAAAKKPVVRSINLEIAGHKISLPPEEAKELRDALLALFPEENKAHEVIIHHDRYPWWYWNSPYCGTWSSNTYGVGTNNAKEIPLSATNANTGNITYTSSGGSFSLEPRFDCVGQES